MAEFNRKEFGENIRKYRKAMGLSQENLARAIGKDFTTISRYEKGDVIPNAEDIKLICDELGIFENDLFNSERKINNTRNSVNPFKTDTLYLYYIAYFPKTDKFGKGKFRLKITEKPDFCRVDFMDYKKDTIHLSGYLLSDSNMADFILENYEENNLRLESTHIILNIARGVNSIMLGSLHCTNGNYVPSNRKCIVSKEDLEFTDELLEKLKISDEEINKLKDCNVLYLDVINKYDFEDED